MSRSQLKPLPPSALSSRMVPDLEDSRINNRPMISEQEFMKNPDSYQPLGSVKGVLNQPTDITRDLNILFNSKQNLGRLHKKLYAEYLRDTSTTKTEREFAEFFLREVKNFVKSKNLNDYVTAEYQATGYNNLNTALEQINADFAAECRKYFPYQTHNPFKADYQVGTLEEKVLKKGFDLSHEDYQSLNMWRSNVTNIANGVHRDNNKIPVYRHSLHARHIDTSNEGLRANNPDRASIESFIPKKYDMTKIYDTHLNYKDESWYGA